MERLACKSYHSDSCLNRCSFCPGTPGSSQTANLFDVPQQRLMDLDESVDLKLSCETAAQQLKLGIKQRNLSPCSQVLSQIVSCCLKVKPMLNSVKPCISPRSSCFNSSLAGRLGGWFALGPGGSDHHRRGRCRCRDQRQDQRMVALGSEFRGPKKMAK